MIGKEYGRNEGSGCNILSSHPWGSTSSTSFYVGKWLSPHHHPIDVCHMVSMVSSDSTFFRTKVRVDEVKQGLHECRRLFYTARWGSWFAL